MKKIFSALFITLITLASYAQETFEFNARLQPNSTYIMKMKSVMEMNIKIETEVEIPEMQNEILTKSESEFTLKTISFTEDQLNNIPFEISYIDVKSNSFVNGKPNNKVEENLKGLYQVKIKGVDNKGKREFGEIEGPDQFKNMFEILYDSFESMSFTPKGTFKINDKVSTLNEMKVPMPDGSEFVFVMETTFTLIKIENGNAYFDINMKSKPSSQKLEAFTIEVDSYDINGKIKLDIKDNNISESTIQGPMIMNLFGAGFKMVMKTDYNYDINSTKL